MTGDTRFTGEPSGRRTVAVVPVAAVQRTTTAAVVEARHPNSGHPSPGPGPRSARPRHRHRRLGGLAAVVTVWLATALTASCGEAFDLVTDRVPAELVPLFQDAADTYGVLNAAQLAAQARVESKFDPGAVSRAGALGIMQFLPATWAEFGVDGNIDGVADPLEPADAIPAAAHYNAWLAETVGHLPGDRVSLVLAAYNAGPGAVHAAGGIPDFAETQAYVEQVHEWAKEYSGQL